MPNYVPGKGPANAKLMFVGEAPGQVEDYQREPFVGPTGFLLNECLKEVGLERRDIYITNVIKYRPPDNKLRRLGELLGPDGQPLTTIDKSISQLWDEIRAINPKIIVSLGNLALRAVFGKGDGFKGVTKWRGSYLPTVSMDYCGVATIHPAALLHNDAELNDDMPAGKSKGPLKYSYRHVLKLDLLKAKRLLDEPKYNPPQRLLEICRDVVQLERFLEQYKDCDTVSVDIEVLKSIPFCIGLAFNSWHAMSIPILNVFSWQNLEGLHDHQLAEMWRLVAVLFESGVKVIGQNFKFDQGQLERICGFRIKNFHCDTGLLAHALHPEFPKALEFTTSIYTNEAYYKDEGREFDWKKDKIDKFLTYNARDAAVTFEVYEEMMKDAGELKVKGFPNWREEFVLGHQMSLHTFYYELENVGFAFDIERQRELSRIYEDKILEAQNELDILAGWHVNTRSPKDVPKLVFEQLKYPFRRNCNEEILVSLISNHSYKKVDGAARMLELVLLIRRLRLNKKKIFEARTDYDGRMRTVYAITGTETGRSSTKILQPPVRPEKIGTPFHTLTKHGDIGSEAREPYISDPGYVLIETDMSQAEARIVALFANDEKLLRLFREKADIHKITAAIIFGIPIQDVNKELRFIGKTCRHAGNYDMGKRRLMELVNTDAKKYKINISISEWRAGILLDKFHAFSPNIRGVFHTQVQEALISNNRVLVNPFGRYRQFFDRWGRELFKEAYAQLPQSTVPDHLRRAGIRAKQRFALEGIDARFIVEAHDALVGLVKIEHADRYTSIVHEEIETPIDFSRCTLSRGQLVIPAESKIGTSYKECDIRNCPGCKFLHKYELKRAVA
jgi:uracil-DNA glycosylase family 4